MEIHVNGERRELTPGSSLAALLNELQYGAQRIAVEVNEEIVPRSEYGSHCLQAGDRVEIVRAIGGG